MHTVKKVLNIAYAHRLLDYNGKCENLHGHNGMVEISLSSETLNSEQMVMDFTELGKTAKKWLDDNLDHKTILSKNDPLLVLLRKEGQPCFETSMNPTAEALAELIFNTLLKAGLPVSEVTFWETPTSMAAYNRSK